LGTKGSKRARVCEAGKIAKSVTCTHVARRDKAVRPGALPKQMVRLTMTEVTFVA